MLLTESIQVHNTSNYYPRITEILKEEINSNRKVKNNCLILAITKNKWINSSEKFLVFEYKCSNVPKFENILKKESSKVAQELVF